MVNGELHGCPTLMLLVEMFKKGIPLAVTSSVCLNSILNVQSNINMFPHLNY